MKKIIILFLVLCGAGLGTSCDDFLTEHPSTQFSPEDVYSSPNGVQAVLNSCYGYISQSNGYGGYLHMLLSWHTPTMQLQNRNSTYMVELATMNVAVDNSTADYVYDGAYQTINTVNDLLMNLHGLAPLCIPINKTGKQAKDFPRMVEAGFASDNQLIMFPAGLCSRRQNGVIRDLDWKKTFIVKSVEAHRDVVPIHFEGRNSNFFYNLANLCKMLGIKFNIAMLYLADEMLKNRHKTFTITIGKPIPWQTFDKSKSPAGWAQYVKDIVYKL